MLTTTKSIALAGLLAVMGVVADTSAQGRGMGGMPGPVSRGDPAAGARTATQTCFACHGADGNSVQSDFPNLAGQKESYLYAQLRNFASGARRNEVMHAMVAALDDRQMQDVSAHFSRQVRKVANTKVPLSVAGRDLYFAGDPARQIPACVECHGDTPTRAWGCEPAAPRRPAGRLSGGATESPARGATHRGAHDADGSLPPVGR